MARFRGLLLLVILVGAGAVQADTTWVAGAVSGSWTAARSPYIATSDIFVPAAQTLRIERGVTVGFAGAYELRVDSTALLLALGEPQDSVVFCNAWLKGQTARWRGIRIKSAADTCRFRYCVLKDAARMGSVDNDGGVLWAVASRLELAHCFLRHNLADTVNSGYGGAASLGSCWLSITDSRFENNSAHTGGALSVWNCTGRIEHSVFRADTALRGGAWLLGNIAGSLRVCDCLWEANTARQMGGAVWCDVVFDVTFERCVFYRNVCHGHGGGLYLRGRPGFSECAFESNSADSLGGAVFAMQEDLIGRVSYDRCTFRGNSALDGGGLYLYNNSLTIRHSLLVGNTAARNGGGLCVDNGIAPKVLGCTFAANGAGGAGGGIYFPAYYSARAIVNCAFVYIASGAAIANLWTPYSSDDAPHNCGFYGNPEGNFSGTIGYGLESTAGTNSNGDSCDVYGNLFLEPWFANAAEGNYHLTARSPFIDAGSLYPELSLDPDGTLPDIGAFSFGLAPAGTPLPKPVAQSFALFPCYPNPFNATARIAFDLPRADYVKLAVYDITGRLVATLADGIVSAGRHEVAFDGANLASGIYFARLEAATRHATQKLVLLK